MSPNTTPIEPRARAQKPACALWPWAVHAPLRHGRGDSPAERRGPAARSAAWALRMDVGRGRSSATAAAASGSGQPFNSFGGGRSALRQVIQHRTRPSLPRRRAAIRFFPRRFNRRVSSELRELSLAHCGCAPPRCAYVFTRIVKPCPTASDFPSPPTPWPISPTGRVRARRRRVERRSWPPRCRPIRWWCAGSPPCWPGRADRRPRRRPGGAWLLSAPETITLDQVLRAVDGCAHLGCPPPGAKGCPVSERIPGAVRRPSTPPTRRRPSGCRRSPSPTCCRAGRRRGSRRLASPQAEA